MPKLIAGVEHWRFGAISVVKPGASREFLNPAVGLIPAVTDEDGTPVVVRDLVTDAVIAAPAVSELGYTGYWWAPSPLLLVSAGGVTVDVVTFEVAAGFRLMGQLQATVATILDRVEQIAASSESEVRRSSQQSLRFITQNPDSSWPVRSTATADLAQPVVWLVLVTNSAGGEIVPPVGAPYFQGIDVVWRPVAVST